MRSTTNPEEYFRDFVETFEQGRGGFIKERSALVRCPAHDDGRPSLKVDLAHEDDKILVHCFAGCTAEAVMAARGETTAVLFTDFVPTASVSGDDDEPDLEDVLEGVPLWRPDAPAPGNAKTDWGLQTVGEIQQHLGAGGDWLVDRMFAAGDVSLLVAKPGIGKSTFAAQLAVCVAQGKSFLGRAVQQGPVIYLAFEGARSTTAHMVRLGHDPHSRGILMWRGDSDGKHPAAWLAKVVGDHEPVLIIVDTLTDFARATPGASNAGYEDMMQKLGGVYAWAQEHDCHVHLIHHGGKGDREGIDTALGTIGIVGKVGTVLDYRPLSKEDGAPRVLKGVKHREGDVEDLPGMVLDFAKGTGLTVAGLREDVEARELGVELIKVVWDTPGIKQSDLVAAVEGRKKGKLKAIHRLVVEGILEREGTGNSRHNPFRLTVKATVGDPVEAWRERFRERVAKWSSSMVFIGSHRFPEPGTDQVQPPQAEKLLVPPYIDEVGNRWIESGTSDFIGSHVTIGTSREPLEVPLAAPAPGSSWCGRCQRFRCQCRG
jgi:AAA domain-containing protein